MSQENKVTVIIPNYNGREYLQGCLESLEAERQVPGTPGFRVLVVDDGSEDPGIREDLERLRGRVEAVFLGENAGFVHAVNEGIRRARTPYVILLNNDTKVLPGFVKALYEAVSRDPGLFSVSARMLMWDRPELLDGAGDRYCVLGWAYARGKGKPASRFGKPARVFSACGGAAVYRRSVFEEIGLFDEAHFAYLEDLDIGYRARIYGYQNAYEPAAAVLHFGSASSGSRYNVFKTRLSSANSTYLIGKNMPLLQLLWNLPFLAAGFLIKALFFAAKGMGGIYLKGCARGIARCLTPEGRAHRVPFRKEHLKNYFKIQLLLYADTFRWILKL